jgi:hypothetical protein
LDSSLIKRSYGWQATGNGLSNRSINSCQVVASADSIAHDGVKHTSLKEWNCIDEDMFVDIPFGIHTPFPIHGQTNTFVARGNQPCEGWISNKFTEKI